jgi:O-antigen/teichoic acid export membrane protein
VLAAVRSWLARFPPGLVRPGALSVADQAVISATNFAVGVTLARLTPAVNYGAYALAIGVMLILASVQAAIVTTPLTILGAARVGDDQRRWVSALLAGQVVLGAALAAVLAVAALAVGRAWGDRTLAGALAALAGALFFVQVQEFCRRVLFLRPTVGRVLVNDVVYCGLQVAGVAALWSLDRRTGAAGAWLSAANVLHVTAGAALVATALGLYQVRELLGRQSLAAAAALLREAWQMGRYNLGAHAGSIVLLYGNRFVAAVFGGTVSVAMLEAPRLLVAPLHVFSISAGSVTSPRAAVEYARGGRKALFRFLLPVAALWAAGHFAYVLMIALAPGFWLRLFYGDKFEGAATILVLWCLCYATASLRVLPGTALRVTRHYAVLMWSSLAAGCVMVAAAVVLCMYLGVEGAVLGRLIGDLALLGFLIAAIVRRLRPADERH